MAVEQQKEGVGFQPVENEKPAGTTQLSGLPSIYFQM